MSTGDRIYERLPVPLQHAAVTAFGLQWRRRRMGGAFRRLRAEAAARHALDADAWETWRIVRLRDVLQRAWTAPGYRERWQAAGVTEADLERVTPDSLPGLLPLLPKDDIRPGADPFCAGGAPAADAIRTDTSGSTGTPVPTYTSRGDFQRSTAIRDAAYDAFAGVHYGLPRATFSGRRVVTAAQPSAPYHRYNAAERQVYFSPYHLSAATAPAYVAALWRHRPVWITGYATLIADLARHVIELGLPCPPLVAAISAAEPVPAGAHELVAEAFGGARLHEEYGMIEDVVVALECEHGALHMLPDAGVVETVRPDGTPCDPGEVGEIVGTSLIRETQPFVRYRTGDLGALAADPCPCGRPMPVLAALEGRVDDVVLGTDGRRVSRMSTIPKGLAGIRATQFVQERAGAVLVRVLAEGELPDATVDALIQRVRDRVGADTAVEVAAVEELERTPRGKLRGVVSRLGERP